VHGVPRYVAGMASAAIFNTLDVTRLRSSGFTEQQAEGIADTLAKDALTELATKADLNKLEAATRVDINKLEAATKAEIKQLELATKQSIKDLELTLTLTLRMAAITAAGLAALGAFLKH